MKLRKNLEGAMGGKALIVLAVILIVVVLYLSGMLALTLPGTSDKYSQTVHRQVTDVGMVVPIDIRLTFRQDATSGANKAVISADVKHKHEELGSDDNFVPDVELISSSDYNNKVAIQGDTTTIFSVNGNSFQASDTTWNTTITSLAGVQFGNVQTQPKVWTKSTVHTPSTPGTSAKDNSALLIQSIWRHYRKATNEELNSYAVNWIIYYELPAYNVDRDYTQTYKYKVYVPFDDFALLEDIRADIFAFSSRCTIEWITIEAVTHTYWDFPIVNKLFGGFLDATGVGELKLVESNDITIPTRIEYHWEPLERFSLDNTNRYWSHSYTYKIR